MTNEFLEQKFKELLYHFGEINWDILTTEAWNKYINNCESFNEKQFEDLRHFTYDIADEFAIGFAEWISYKYKYLDNKGWFRSSFELEMGIFISSQELLEIYKMVYDLDPKQNVTDWVRDRIKSKTLENN